MSRSRETVAATIALLAEHGKTPWTRKRPPRKTAAPQQQASTAIESDGPANWTICKLAAEFGAPFLESGCELLGN